MLTARSMPPSRGRGASPSTRRTAWRELPVKNCSTIASFSAPRPESAHARAVRSASSPTRFCSAESPPSSLICKSSPTSASAKADEDKGWVFEMQPANILGMESASRPWRDGSSVLGTTRAGRKRETNARSSLRGEWRDSGTSWEVCK
jgi:hypothetical protein